MEPGKRNEAEKAVIFLMLLLGVLGLGTLVERLVFLVGSEPATARVVGESVSDVHLSGSPQRPTGQTISSTALAVSFEDASGQWGYSSDLRYFFAPPRDSAFVVRRDGEDLRRGGFDLFAIPLLCLVAAAGLEPVRRRARRR